VTGRALVVRGDALRLPLPDACADLIITSPPYFALRAYNAGPGELGSEPTPALFLEALWAATREMARVLKPSGSIFVNLGDKYSGLSVNRNGLGASTLVGHGGNGTERDRHTNWHQSGTTSIREKSLLGLPWAYALGAIGMLAALGGPDPHLNLILRAELVWAKPNGLPESVTDRVRRSHESWFHLVKQPRYYAAVDEIRIPHAATSVLRFGGAPRVPKGDGSGQIGSQGWGERSPEINGHPLGALPGSVWSIPSEPLRLPDWLNVQHYAAFPSEWPRRLILGWSPPGICLECGDGRVPVVDRQYEQRQETNNPYKTGRSNGMGNEQARTDFVRLRAEATILGYACRCTPYTDYPERRRPSMTPRTSGSLQVEVPATGEQHAWPERQPIREYHLDGWRPPPTRPALVVDSFGGTGTVAMVARALGRHAVSVDLSHAYCRAARWRVTSDNSAKAISRTNRERQGSLL
jgi:DNA modification methylase